jgi:hypothetical protein
MWLCFNNAFVSAVAHHSQPDMLVVRARMKEHLENLFPDMKDRIIMAPERDYRWRVLVDRKQFADLVASRIEEISYTNFKDSVKDDELHDMYLTWWSDHYQLQARHDPVIRRSKRKGKKKFKKNQGYYDSLFGKGNV